MSDSENSDDMTSSILAKLNGPLFNGASAPERSDNVPYYAVTINPDPYVKVNNKRYSSYSYGQQCAMLLRMHNAVLRDNPTIECEAMVFEMCPNLKQAHYHCLIRCPDIWLSTYTNYLSRRLLRDNSPSWRFAVTKEVFDMNGWIMYMNKNLH